LGKPGLQLQSEGAVLDRLWPGVVEQITSTTGVIERRSNREGTGSFILKDLYCAGPTAKEHGKQNRSPEAMPTRQQRRPKEGKRRKGGEGEAGGENSTWPGEQRHKRGKGEWG